jgi:hypothetical protein
VIDRVHGDSAYLRPPAEVARPPGLSERDVHVIFVSDLTDRSSAPAEYHSHLAGGQLHGYIITVLGDYDCADTCRAGKLTAAAKL